MAEMTFKWVYLIEDPEKLPQRQGEACLTRRAVIESEDR
jgi:hypothetical protein